MELFINVKSDISVQLGDKIRFDLSSSFVSRPGVTAVDIVRIEVDPLSTGVFITIHDSTIPALKFAPKDWYFDYVYADKAEAVSSIQSIDFRLTDSDATVKTSSRDTLLMTKAEDNLFSSDDDLIYYEPDILKWLPSGRSTWNYVHRRAQARILSYLFEKGYKNENGSAYLKTQILDKYDMKEWSTFMTLKLIFGSMINSKDDVFAQKSAFYENLEGRANTTSVRVDINSDGIQSVEETVSLDGPRLVRR